MVKMRFMFIVLIFALSISFFYPKRSHADITIPFSSTFNCPEQNQSTAGWVNCDGLKRAGAHTTSAGNVSQITSSANFPGGGGGRGHRYWIGPGTNNNSGGIDFEFPPQSELYVRWYVRWQPGLDLNNSQKMLYFAFGQNVYFDMGDNSTAIRVVVSGEPSTVQGWGWDQLSDGNALANISDGSWHCTEIHVKRVPGSNNDIAEWWFDGVRRLHFTNLNFSSDFTIFGAPANQRANVSVDMWNDTDDFEVRTTGPIGCLDAPAPPQNLEVR